MLFILACALSAFQWQMFSRFTGDKKYSTALSSRINNRSFNSPTPIFLFDLDAHTEWAQWRPAPPTFGFFFFWGGWRGHSFQDLTPDFATGWTWHTWMVAGLGFPWLHWADLTVTINNNDSGHDTSCDPWSIFGLYPFDGFSKMSLGTRCIFIYFFLINILQENENLSEKKCFTVFCNFSKQENCGKHLRAVWGSWSASMEPDPLHCLLSHQLSAAFTNTQSMSFAYKIICERLWQISYWAVWNLTNNEDIGISKTKTSNNASKQTNSILLSMFCKCPPPQQQLHANKTYWTGLVE